MEMALMSDAAARGSNSEVIVVSRRIHELVSIIHRSSREVAEVCKDPILKDQVMSIVHAISNISVQLKIITAVKAAGGPNDTSIKVNTELKKQKQKQKQKQKSPTHTTHAHTQLYYHAPLPITHTHTHHLAICMQFLLEQQYVTHLSLSLSLLSLSLNYLNKGPIGQVCQGSGIQRGQRLQRCGDRLHPYVRGHAPPH